SLLGAGLALVALALAFTDWALSLRPGVTEANFKRIRKGMTLAEVQALLGGPGQVATFEIGAAGKVTRRVSYWPAEGGPVRASVWFDRHDLVEVAEFLSHDFCWVTKPGPLARLRAWLAGLAANLPHDAGNLK